MPANAWFNLSFSRMCFSMSIPPHLLPNPLCLVMQNHLLEQIFESIDASFSTQAEFLNAFKETKEAQIKAFQKQEEAAQAQIKAARKQEEAAQAQIRAACKQEEAAEAQIRAVQAQERAAEALEEAADSFREASDSVKEPEYTEPHK